MKTPQSQPLVGKVPWLSKLGVAATLVSAIAGADLQAAPAHRYGNTSASELSALSFLPVALSVVAPVALLTVGAVYTVRAVELSAQGTVWVLERSSDGARASITLAGAAAGGASVVAGATVSALACSAGWVLHAGGRALAFVPNERGRTLLHNEQVSR